jgi:hypothetical protein
MSPAPHPTAVESELAALRRRAYGPDADIGDDATALARLHELEDALRRDEVRAATPVAVSEASTPSVPVVQSGATDGSPVARDASAMPAQHGSPVVTDAPPSPEPAVSTPARWWKRIPAWAFVVAAFAAGAAAGSVMTASAAPDTEPDMLLRVDPSPGERGLNWNSTLSSWGLNPGSEVPHDDFHTIDVWAARDDLDQPCILLTQAGFPLWAECSPPGLPVVLDFTVSEGLPFILDPELPVGTAIRFVSAPGGIEVWVRERTAPDSQS